MYSVQAQFELRRAPVQLAQHVVGKAHRDGVHRCIPIRMTDWKTTIESGAFFSDRTTRRMLDSRAGRCRAACGHSC
jgi:hypothetical protein